MEGWQMRALNLMLGLGKPNEKSPSVIDYAPAKLALNGEERPYFKRTAPEKRKLCSRRLSSMLFELEADERSNVHSLMVIKDGAFQKAQINQRLLHFTYFFASAPVI